MGNLFYRCSDSLHPFRLDRVTAHYEFRESSRTLFSFFKRIFRRAALLISETLPPSVLGTSVFFFFGRQDNGLGPFSFFFKRFTCESDLELESGQATYGGLFESHEGFSGEPTFPFTHTFGALSSIFIFFFSNAIVFLCSSVSSVAARLNFCTCSVEASEGSSKVIALCSFKRGTPGISRSAQSELHRGKRHITGFCFMKSVFFSRDPDNRLLTDHLVDLVGQLWILSCHEVVAGVSISDFLQEALRCGYRLAVSALLNSVVLQNL